MSELPPYPGDDWESWEFENQELENQEYVYFQDEQSRKELVDYAIMMTEVLHQGQVKNLILLDRSARPFHVAIRESWHHFFPDEEMPGIYFANPKGFQSTQEQHPADILLEILDAHMKGDTYGPPAPDRSFQKITSEVATTYPGLMKEKDDLLLIFDTCMHSGLAMGSVASVLHEAGFSKIATGTVSPSTSKVEIVRPSLSLNQTVANKRCHPFGEDFMVNKSFNQLLSLPNRDPEARRQSIALRREIKRIMEENLSRIPPDLLR